MVESNEEMVFGYFLSREEFDKRDEAGKISDLMDLVSNEGLDKDWEHADEVILSSTDDGVAFGIVIAMGPDEGEAEYIDVNRLKGLISDGALSDHLKDAFMEIFNGGEDDVDLPALFLWKNASF